MALSKKEWDIEYQRLVDVMKIINSNISFLEIKINNSLMQIKKSNKDMWEQSKSNFTDLDDIVEALSFLDGINSDKMRHENEIKFLRKLKLLKKSAYFGRVDFKENDYIETDQIYIGTSTLDGNEGNILIYDWRAAICSMFYEQEKGHAIFKSPEGKVEGEILLKRQYRIFYDEIQSMFESSVKIDDEILQEVLSESKDSKMGIIVTSIQKEQNIAIRNETDRIVLVDGPAGSGKTSIALHRIAWLLYRYRESIKPKNVVVYSPNEIFNDYISDVLPELGEENMRMSTFISLARSYLGGRYYFRDKYYQIEGILRNYGNRKNHAIKEKGSFLFTEQIDEYVKKLGKGYFEFESISYDEKSIGSKDELNKLFFYDFRTHNMALRFEKLRTLLFKRLNNLVVIMRKEYMRIPRMDYERRKKAVYLARTISNKMRELIDQFTRPDFYKLYGNFLEEYEYTHYAKRFIERLNQGVVNYEDIAPVMMIKATMGYKNPIKQIKHVIIDEVQDCSVVELLVITKLYEQSSFTLLGDTNQAINYLTGLDKLDDITIPGASLVKLTKSYRSTKQITEFCYRILGDTYSYEYVDRNGKTPIIVSAKDHLISNIKNSIDVMKEDGLKSIAIITRTGKSANEIYNNLEIDDCKQIKPKDETYIMGTVVLPSYLAKGLEFDGVILVCLDRDNYNDENDRKLLYTCCSRALHQLNIFYEFDRPLLLPSS